MLQFEGHQAVPRSLSEVWGQLSDVRFLVQCIPDINTISKSEQDEALLNVRPGLSFIQGSLDVKVQIPERIPNQSIKVLLSSKGIGTTSVVETVMHLAETPAGTAIHWVAEITQLGGLLKLVPKGLIRGAAEKVIGNAWEKVVEKLQEVQA